MVKADISPRFEDTVVEIDAGLKAVLEAGEGLLAAIPKPASIVAYFDSEAFAELGALRLAFLIEQKSSYGKLASQVMRIGDAVDDERAVFVQRENPQASDIAVGFFSKRLMRRRIEQRAVRNGGIERLRTMLGRADRLAGLIEAHRRSVTSQRTTAENALAGLAGLRSIDAPGAAPGGEDGSASDGVGKMSGKLDFERMVGQVDTVARALNAGVRDLNLLLQKLSLDIENLLDLYSVLLSFDREREAHRLSPDAYPHITRPVWRFGHELLPGGRLERSRQRTDVAFAKRFEGA